MRILLLNGPPRCGKDTVAQGLLHHLGERGRHVKFAEPLRKAVPALFGLTPDHWDFLYTQRKEDPRLELHGLSVRSAMIWLSEEVMKPTFGIEIFGFLAVNQIRALPAETIVISDCGFTHEIGPLVNAFGPDTLAVLQIHRDGCTFNGDSRNWVDYPGVRTLHVHNNSTIADVVNRAIKTMNHWLNTGEAQ